MIKKIVPLILTGLLLLGLLVTVGLGFHWYHTARKPGQPLGYSHYLHIEKVALQCQKCHRYTDTAPNAGIPAMQVCMDCHKTAVVDRPEVKKLLDYWDKKEPIPWAKVHNLPWHVYFTHKRHIKAGIECTQCHGEVKAMGTVRQVRSLEMGWCVTCHRENNAPTDCLVCHK